MTKACENCAFFKAPRPASPFGQCKFGPPGISRDVMQLVDYGPGAWLGEWPWTVRGDVCGRHMAASLPPQPKTTGVGDVSVEPE